MNNSKISQQSKILKKSVVITPDFVADEIYQNLKRYPIKNILDIGCWNGSLSRPFKKKRNTKITGIDIDNTFENNFDKFIHKDFLKTTAADFEVKPDLILSNPPFNKNYPYMFLNHIIDLFGNHIPIVFIVGSWFSTTSNKRMEYLNTLNITRKTTLHKNTFKDCGVSIDSNILYFNIKQKTQIDFLKPKKLEKKQKFKTIAFSHEQVEYLKKYDNFSGLMKQLIKNYDKDFPFND